MREVVYMGYSERMLELLYNSKLFQCSFVIGAKGRMSPEFYRRIKQYKITYIEVENKVDLCDKIHSADNIELFIIYKFEFIIPDSMIRNHKIFNFHGGDLRTNRGAHATIWSILLREKETCLSCYQLTDKGIDEGNLIATYPVTIDSNDNPITLNKKLARGIPCLLASIEEYLSGQRKAKLITDGIYRRKIVKADYTLQLSDDSFSTMEGKILSQYAYKGAVAIWDNIEFHIKQYSICKTDKYTEERIILKDNDTIVIYEHDLQFIMHLI